MTETPLECVQFRLVSKKKITYLEKSTKKDLCVYITLIYIYIYIYKIDVDVQNFARVYIKVPLKISSENEYFQYAIISWPNKYKFALPEK